MSVDRWTRTSDRSAGCNDSADVPAQRALECGWSGAGDRRCEHWNREQGAQPWTARSTWRPWSPPSSRRTTVPFWSATDTRRRAPELLASIYRYARALDGLGIGRGDLVALHAPNSPDALAVRYAAHLLGAATMYLPALPAPHQRAALVELIAPDLLVAFPRRRTCCRRLRRCGSPSSGATCPAPGCGSTGARTVCRRRRCRAGPVRATSPWSSPPAARPACRRAASGRSPATPPRSATGPDPARRQLANGPLAHLTQLLVDTTLLGGGTVVLQDDVEPAATLAAIESARITDLFLVEPQLFSMIDHPDVATRDLSSLRAVVHIGASAPATLRRRAHARLGAVMAHTYGASETGIVSALPPAEYGRPERVTCAGRLRPGVEVRFRRADGTLAGPGEAGVVEVRSPQLASGYRNRPAEAAVAFVDGWYRTGDVARLDADGYLHILGRARDLATAPVRDDGTLVTPTAVQDTLCRVAGIRYAVVVPDLDTGRWVAAVVTAAAGIGSAARAAVADEHGPAAAALLVVVPVDEVPLTEQGKPDRPTIRHLGARRVA